MFKKGMAWLIIFILVLGVVSPQSVSAEDKINLSEAVIKVSDQIYTQWPRTPTGDVKLNGQTLQIWRDYAVSWTDNEKVGTAHAVFTGIGKYTGSVDKTFEITKSTNGLLSDVLIIQPNDQAYTGSPVEPYIEVESEGVLLKPEDYVCYFRGEHTNVGTVTFGATTRGSYLTASIPESTFKIIATDSSKINIAGADVFASACTFTGKDVKPDVTVSYQGKVLQPGTDYSLAYSKEKNGNIGTHAITVYGEGAYTGSKQKTYEVNPRPLTAADFKPIGTQVYTGSGIVPGVMLSDENAIRILNPGSYRLSYTDNVDPGEGHCIVTGFGDLSGSVDIPFTIVKASENAKSLKDARIEAVPTQAWKNGQAIMPKPAVYYQGKQLTEGTDFSYSYENNYNGTSAASMARVTANGIGNYKDSISTTFAISETKLVSLKSILISMIPDQTYTGKELTPAPVLTNGSSLVKGKDYLVSYYNNIKVGTASVVITGIGKYTDQVTLTFNILAAGKKSVRVSGPNRYETAYEVVKTAFPNGCDKVILASGASWPSALSAAGLAGVEGCPVLLTGRNKLNAKTASLIKILKAKKVILIGGASSLSEGVKTDLLAMGFSDADITRIAGANRRETAEKICYQIRIWSKPKTCIVCAGSRFPDALSISAYAYANGFPILLTDGNGNLTTSSLGIARSFDKILLIGGKDSVSLEAEKQLSGKTTQRIQGKNRYGTSTEIIRTLYGGGTATAVISTGLNFPDALVGSALAVKKGGPILLVDGHTASLTDTQKAILKKAQNVWITGSAASVSDGMKNAVDSAMK